MNRLWDTGDIHNDTDVRRLAYHNRQNKDMDKSDIIFVNGDFGFPWDGSNTDKYWFKWMDKEYRGTVAFVDGNHCNFDLLYQYPIIEKWGGKVHKLNDSVFHLIRGEIYNIYGNTFFTFGGAHSVDKQYRIEGKSWWSQEVPTREEENYALDNLEKAGNKVDYILTHEAPLYIKGLNSTAEESVRRFLMHIQQTVDYKHWYFGHHHIDKEYPEIKATCLYTDIIEIKKK